MKRIGVIGVVGVVVGLMSCIAAGVQETLTPEEQLLVLQQRVAASKPTSMQNVSEMSVDFANACKSFLTVFDEGTSITIERVNQFMETPAGKMTVFMVGWKIFAKDAMNITGKIARTILGFILLIPYLYAVTRMTQYWITGRNVLVSKDGKVKTYKWMTPPANDLSGESYGGWAVMSCLMIGAYTIVIVILLFV